MNINTLKAACYWAEHPNTIRYVEKNAIIPIGLAGMGLLGGSDIWNAQPEERKKIIIRDALVLGATGIGTYIGAMGLRAQRFKLFPALMRFDEEEGRKELKDAINHSVAFLKQHADTYSPELISQIQKLSEKKDTLKDVLHQRREYFNFFEKMQTKFEAKHGSIQNAKALWKKHVTDLMPPEENEGFLEEAKKAGSFFLVGGLSVLSGLAGGLMANKVNRNKDSDATVNMIKEGIFQFVANIALCAVGAGIALGVVNGEWGPKDTTLRKIGDQFAEKIAKHPLKKVFRTGIIGAGLSIGIFGGGHIANWLGRNYVNPFFDKLQGKVHALNEQAPSTGKRKIEFSDAILHLDDVPTAMALAGVKIIEPIIPLFFAFSGYRTGIGYRNDPSVQKPRPPHKVKIQNQIPQPQNKIDLGTFTPSNTFALFKEQYPPLTQPDFSLQNSLPQASLPIGGPFNLSTQYNPWPSAFQNRQTQMMPSFQYG
jgi:hypothetical protein